MGARWTLKALAYLLVITNLTAWAIADDALLVEDIESAVILEMHVNHLKAPIRSRVELERHLATGDSPIYALSDGARELFLESLVFGENGLASFRKAELEAELTPTQIYEILSLFGFQGAITGFGNARIETQEDLKLLSTSTAGNVLTSGRCGQYVEGRCWSAATCKVTLNYCCSPPHCPGRQIP